MLTTITFDADGTLWDFSSAMHEALERTLAELRKLAPGPKTEVLTLADLQQTRDTIAQALQGRKVSLEQIRLKAFAQTLRDVGQDDHELALYLTEVYLVQRFATIKLYPDVLPTLSVLREQYRLGLVSNGNTYPERCGLPNTFTFTAFAHDHKVQKPHPQFYEHALTLAQAKPEEVLHVGDSLRNDVWGSQAIGIRAVWLNRDRLQNETSIRPLAEITSLAQLPAILVAL